MGIKYKKFNKHYNQYDFEVSEHILTLWFLSIPPLLLSLPTFPVYFWSDNFLFMFAFAYCVAMGKLGLKVWVLVLEPCISMGLLPSLTQEDCTGGPIPRHVKSGISLWYSESLDTVSFGELKYTRKKYFLKSMKSNIMKYLPFVLSVVRRFFCIYLEVSNASCFCEKKLPYHGSVHFRRRINIEYDTASLDRTDALTMEGIFFVHSFIKHQQWLSRSAPAEKYLF